MPHVPSLDRPVFKALYVHLVRHAETIATHFDLVYKKITAERPHVETHYGVCFSDGVIRIRLNDPRSGEPLPYAELFDTLCHELAHLRHFHHRRSFWAFHRQVKAWATRQGMHVGPKRPEDPSSRPARGRSGRATARRPGDPRQLSLF